MWWWRRWHGATARRAGWVHFKVAGALFFWVLATRPTDVKKGSCLSAHGSCHWWVGGNKESSRFANTKTVKSREMVRAGFFWFHSIFGWDGKCFFLTREVWFCVSQLRQCDFFLFFVLCFVVFWGCFCAFWQLLLVFFFVFLRVSAKKNWFFFSR